MLWWKTRIYSHWLGNQLPVTLQNLPEVPEFFSRAIFLADNSEGLFLSPNPLSIPQKYWPLSNEPYSRGLHGYRWVTLNTFSASNAKLNYKLQGNILKWIELWEHWHSFVWRSDLLGERIGYWLSLHQAICMNASPNFRKKFYVCLFRQAKHLHHAHLEDTNSWHCFLAHWGRIYSAFAFTAFNKKRKRTIKYFELDIQKHVLPDGGHISRSPSIALALLAILVNVRDLLICFQQTLPEALVAGIDRLAPFVKALRHGDGGFALFGGSIEGNSDLIDEVLKASKTNPRAITNARYTGFSRLRAGQTTAIFDSGILSEPHYRNTSSASALAFELSNGKSRLVCNCGNRTAKKTTIWNKALFASAAYSTITLADKSVSSIFHVIHNRNDYKGSRFVEATHDAYYREFGVNITRTLYLSSDGHDFRGEDKVTGDSNAPFVIRFHIHPDVRIFQLERKTRAILKPLNGHTWQFDCLLPFTIEKSVYFGSGHLRRTLMLAVNGCLTKNETLIKWKFSTQASPKI
ncbi:MAG: hypothetical protein CFH06_01696 [Alphaproteobacteria bacterium MarineAlpha3_Bin5]|nr:hypothetical protein [Magnetovibrio sp.]PPR76677.1 MAG: hypothetical protein CFH06_01696 [Alphaproteobacteria bacterium MarineAlpha3_Bin5]